jgi:hypothetical protein
VAVLAPACHDAGVAGYSGTPLPKKLGIREGSRVALVEAPDSFERTLSPLPNGVAVSSRVRAPLDVILYFTARLSELERRFAKLARALDAAGGLWIAWPKRSSKVATDLDQAAVMDVGLATGLVDNKVCAIDETWSGLRFVVRRENRAAWPPALP